MGAANQHLLGTSGKNSDDHAEALPSSTSRDVWLRRASYGAIAVGVVCYLAGIAVTFGADGYVPGTLDHLAVRGVSSVLAACALVAGLLLNRPKNALPWVLFTLVDLTYALRPLLTHMDLIAVWDGWLAFGAVVLRRSIDVAAIVAIVGLRKVGKITDIRIDSAVVALAFFALSIHYVLNQVGSSAMPFPLFISYAFIIPFTYGIIVIFTCHILFIDTIKGVSFQLIVSAWAVNIAFQVIGLNVFMQPDSIMNAAIADVFGLSAFLFAAASLHPSMHELSQPSLLARSEWSKTRSISLGVAALIPLAMSQFDHAPMERTALFVVGGLILVMLIIRARGAVASLVASRGELVSQMRTDHLTGLDNRRHFYSVLEDAVRERREFAVMLADIDGFKQVNDAHGHSVGDEVLRQIAERIGWASTDAMSTARIGGDEFAILLPGRPASDLVRLGTQITEACSLPVLVSNHLVKVGASVGINEVGAEDFDARANLHLERADYALFHAKQAGRGRVALFTPEHEEAIRRSALVEQILKGADIGTELHVVFQPIVLANNLKLNGFEALVRWNSPVLGAVSPAEFIPIAEACGIIHDITRVVLKNTLAEMRKWPANVRLKINLSTNDLLSSHQMLSLLSIMEREGADGSRLTFEITETAFSGNVDAIQEGITLLRSTGASIAIDDFGTGYSSLSGIHHMHPNLIKIDRSFVGRIDDDGTGRAMIKTIIEMCRNLGTRSLAEGVETRAQARRLIELGCDELQGFLFSPPVTADMALQIVRTGSAALPAELDRLRFAGGAS